MAAGPNTECLQHSARESPVSLEQRALDSFERIEVKPPFTTAPQFGQYHPTRQQLRGIAFRLKQLRTESELLGLPDREFDRAVMQVWELVRWIHTEDELMPTDLR
jgi:hypothetical protein